MKKNVMTINGHTFEFSGGGVSIQSNGVFVNGVEVSKGMELGRKIEVHIHGNTGDIDATGNVTIHGDVKGDVKASGDIQAKNVGGDAKASGDVHASHITGSVKASGDVRATTIQGNVKASGDVYCR